MSWQDESDLTDTADGEGQLKSGVVGKLFAGETATVRFKDNGEMVERDHGTQVEFDAELIDCTGRVESWGGDKIEPDTEFSFETGSSALLSKLAPFGDLTGLVLKIRRNYDGPAPADKYYTVEEAE